MTNNFSSNLAIKLREGTTKSHSMAENMSFVKSFLSGVVDQKSYRKLIANLYFIYSAIEDEMERNKLDPIINSIYFPQLNRKKALELDLKFYYGDNWETLISPSVATQVYVQRIHNIGKEQPFLLVAHSYTRYLGDLSGGQILKKIAQSAMNLSNNQGAAFYEFQEIDDEVAFKEKYRNSLNALRLNQAQITDIIAEANLSFGLNMKIFQELDTNFLKVIFKFIANFVSHNSKTNLLVRVEK